MNSMVFDGFGGWMYGYLRGRGTSIYNISGLSQAMHVHVLGRQVHCFNHYGIVMSSGQLCWLPSFIRV